MYLSKLKVEFLILCVFWIAKGKESRKCYNHNVINRDYTGISSEGVFFHRLFRIPLETKLKASVIDAVGLINCNKSPRLVSANYPLIF